MARRIYAGADFFAMPSRFEPCGQGQMIALRYGTPPDRRIKTGGLADTVVDETSHPGRGTGFAFEAPGRSPASSRACVAAVEPARGGCGAVGRPARPRDGGRLRLGDAAQRHATSRPTGERSSSASASCRGSSVRPRAGGLSPGRGGAPPSVSIRVRPLRRVRGARDRQRRGPRPAGSDRGHGGVGHEAPCRRVCRMNHIGIPQPPDLPGWRAHRPSPRSRERRPWPPASI